MALFIFLALGCMPFVLYAQTDTAVESLLETAAQETDVSPVLDAVDYFTAFPLPLRSATVKELLLIPGFSPSTARAIIRMVQADTVQNYEQIAGSLGLSGEQLQLLRLCTTLAPVAAPVVVAWRVRYRGRFDTPRGITNGSFAGSPLELYQRCTASWQHMEASIATDKDAGEPSVVDFVGGYLRSAFGTSTVLLGDYTVQSGMGSVLGSLFGSRKGGDVLSPTVHSRTSVVPQRSTAEQNFFRGLAFEHSFPVVGPDTLSAAVWFSSVRRAATLDTTGAATALDADGYFRTDAEIARRGILGEQAGGLTVEWQGESLVAGVSALGLRYSRPVHSISQTAFSGTRGILLSLHGIVHRNDITAAAEIARDASGNTGVRAGIEHHAGALRWALSFRTFPLQFRSPYGSSFGEFPRPGNETGFYAGCRWRPSSALAVSLYADIYRTAGPTFTVPVPIRGLDLSAEGRLALSPHTDVLFRIRREDRTDAGTNEFQTVLFRNTRSSLRAEVQHELSDPLRIRFRCEAVQRTFDGFKNKETGMLQFLDIRYRIGRLLTVTSRLAYYHTDSFDTAIWAYEPTVPGAMASPAHYGGGMQWTALLQYRPVRALCLSIAVGITSKNNVETLGSGLMEIDGDTERKFSLQMDMVW